MSRFLLNNLVAKFPFHSERPSGDDRFRTVSSEDVKTEQWLASTRRYNNITLRPLFVLNTPEDNNIARPAFFGNGTVTSFPNALYVVEIIEDEFDQHDLCDALYAAMALYEEQFDDDLVFIPIEDNDIPDNRTITVDTAISWYDGSFDTVAQRHNQYTLFSGRTDFGYGFDDAVWMTAAAIAEDEKFLYASMFLREAIRDFFFVGPDARDVLHDMNAQPLSVAMAARVENSIHNCYKVLEAVSGGNLPKGQDKIVKKFLRIGVNLEEVVGFNAENVEKEPAIEKVIRLRRSRNYKAAHGKVHSDRKSTFYELMDFQQLARFVLFSAIHDQ